jgi:excisionase family DNA binding protein
MDQHNTAGASPQEFYSVQQMAAKLDMHPYTVRRRVWDGSIKALRFGPKKAIRIPQSEYERLAA